MSSARRENTNLAQIGLFTWPQRKGGPETEREGEGGGGLESDLAHDGAARRRANATGQIFICLDFIIFNENPTEDEPEAEQGGGGAGEGKGMHNFA